MISHFMHMHIDFLRLGGRGGAKYFLEFGNMHLIAYASIAAAVSCGRICEDNYILVGSKFQN